MRGVRCLVPVVAAAGLFVVLAAGDLLDLWRRSEAAPLVKCCVAVTGSLIALLFSAGFAWSSLRRDDEATPQIRLRGMLIAGAVCLLVFFTPLFRVMADTLGTLAGLLLGLALFLFSRFFGL